MPRTEASDVLMIAFEIDEGTGGIRRYCARVVRALAESGARGVVLALRDERSERIDKGLTIRGAGRGRARLLLAASRTARASSPRTLILGHVLLWPVALVVKVLRPRCRVVLLAYGRDVWGRPPRARRLAVRRLCSQIVCISRSTRERMSIAFGIPAADMDLIAPAVDDPPPHTSRASDDAVVLSVCRLDAADASKGIDRVIDALPAVRAAVPGARLVVVGEGSMRPRLEQLAARRDLRGAVTFTGFIDDEALDETYASASVFVMPSAKEGFGIVYLEAWRRGVPVIAGAGDAGAEVVEDGVTGFVVDPSDEHALAARITALLSDDALRDRMGSAGHAVVRERYLHERFRSDVEAVLLGGGR